MLTKKLMRQLAHVFIYLFNALQEEARPVYTEFLKTTFKIIDDGFFVVVGKTAQRHNSEI